MSQLISQLEQAGITLPDELLNLLSSCKGYTVFNTVDELALVAVGGPDSNNFEVSYDIPGKGLYTEAVVHRGQQWNCG